MIPIILPGTTRLVDAAQACPPGVGLWITPRGRFVIHPHGRPGWRRLPIKLRSAA